MPKHLLFVHPNYPAQFGHVARWLARNRGWRCTFVSETPPGNDGQIEKIQYRPAGGATRQNHFCTRTFENAVWHCDGVYQALQARPDLRPDLIIGHSGFGSTLFLRQLYPEVPVINLFEFYYRPRDPQSDMNFRQDLGWTLPDMAYLRAECRNAMLLLDLQNCQAGYCPTQFQRSQFPEQYLPKLRVIFDGIDRTIYHGQGQRLRPPIGQRPPRTIAGVAVGPQTRVVTYVSRGFESMRGFDIFMRAARRIASRFADVHFFVVGDDRICYGGDENYIRPHSTFRQWVLSREPFDLEKFTFVGRLQPIELGRLLAASDLHIYLTVPFVLSWSMMNAMSCGAVVLGSDTAPVREMIRDGENGLLADFFDADQIADRAIAVLKDPAQHRPLGEAAERLIAQRYSMEAVMPQMLDLYESVTPGRG